MIKNKDMEKIVTQHQDRPDGNWDLIYAYQFTESEFKIIFPMMIKAIDKKLASLRKKIDYFEGIKEIGEATNRQNDRLMYYEDAYDLFIRIKNACIKAKNDEKV
jgi:hypothetical protein